MAKLKLELFHGLQRPFVLKETEEQTSFQWKEYYHKLYLDGSIDAVCGVR